VNFCVPPAATETLAGLMSMFVSVWLTGEVDLARGREIAASLIVTL